MDAGEHHLELGLVKNPGRERGGRGGGEVGVVGRTAERDDVGEIFLQKRGGIAERHRVDGGDDAGVVRWQWVSEKDQALALFAP